MCSVGVWSSAVVREECLVSGPGPGVHRKPSTWSWQDKTSSACADDMLITLCYVYLWVRFHRCYSVLIRNGLFRRSGVKSFSFSRCSGTGFGPGSRPDPGPVGDDVFLQLGDKAVYVTEPQVRHHCGCVEGAVLAFLRALFSKTPGFNL